MSFKRQHKTARGLKFDMEMFTQSKKDEVALGNLGGAKNVNARGDILGKGGKIEVKREEIVRSYYREDLPVEKETAITKTKTEQPVVETFFTPEEALKKLAEESATEDPTTKPRRKKIVD